MPGSKLLKCQDAHQPDTEQATYRPCNQSAAQSAFKQVRASLGSTCMTYGQLLEGHQLHALRKSWQTHKEDRSSERLQPRQSNYNNHLFNQRLDNSRQQGRVVTAHC
eukprot:GHRR01026056.1.p1 GENE.GHRR01026056.1~~GHRR01026056.1.p1  ORF type:complete len:107 (-),score=30.87 GHRR01026056.1:774-1094(-)